MTEKKVPFISVKEDFWLKRDKFIKLNPMGIVPFLAHKPNILIAGFFAITEYIEAKFIDNPMISGSIEQQAEIRRLCCWFNEKFYYECSENILYEKVINFFKSNAMPDMTLIKIAKVNMLYHFAYIEFLLNQRSWLAGDRFSVADMVAASHISILDYLGEINWGKHQQIKEWYSVVKSKPCFRDILQDRVAGFTPPSYYSDFDF